MSVSVGLAISGEQLGSESHDGGPVGYRLFTGCAASAMLTGEPNKAKLPADVEAQA